MLKPEQQAMYQRDGYIVLANFKSPDALRALRQRAEEMVDAFAPPVTKTIFPANE